MACRVISTANSGLPRTYCTAFRCWPTIRRSVPWSLVLNSMKPLGPAIASILALAPSASPPPASALYTSGSNLPSPRSNAACTSAKGLSAVIRTRQWRDPASFGIIRSATVESRAEAGAASAGAAFAIERLREPLERAERVRGGRKERVACLRDSHLAACCIGSTSKRCGTGRRSRSDWGSLVLWQGEKLNSSERDDEERNCHPGNAGCPGAAESRRAAL